MTAGDGTVRDSDRRDIRADCVALSNAFAYHLDHREYEALTDLFTEDGLWNRHGQLLRGREQMLAALRARPANQFTRHVATGFHFTHIGETEARAVAYNMSYFSMEGGGDLPLRYVPEQSMLQDFVDHYVQTPRGWRFRERNINLVMVSDHVRQLLSLPRK